MSTFMFNHVRHGAIALTLAGALALGVAHAQTAAQTKPVAAPTGEAAKVKKVLEDKFPGAAISNVTKTPYFGLYEAMLEDKIIYTDVTAKYVMVGSVYDTTTKTNLTEARQRKLNRVALDKLPMNLAFKRVKGDGSRKLIIFSDADCPFCHRLED